MIKDCPLSPKEQLRTKLKGKCIESPRSCGGVCSYYQRRALNGIWTDELVDDLKSVHGLDVEEDLLKMWADAVIKSRND